MVSDAYDIKKSGQSVKSLRKLREAACLPISGPVRG